MSIPFLDAAEIGNRLSPLAAVDALEAALRSGLDADADPPRSAVALDTGELLVMPSGAAGFGMVKVLGIGGTPRVQGVCVAFDRHTLAPAALLDGIAVTNLRTAAVSALAARHLATPGSARLLVFGRGPQAHAHVETLRSVLPIEHVDMLGREDPAPSELIAAADVICCCTTAREPLFGGHLVGDGALVIAIGSHEPAARETDDALAARASVVVESAACARREAGDVILAVRSGALAFDELITLTDIVRGTRSAAGGAPRLFKSVGMAWQDAVILERVLESGAPRRGSSRVG